MTTKRASRFAALVVCALISGCSGAGPGSGADKAGGLAARAGGPLVLTLANTSGGGLTDVPPIAYFVHRLEQLSRRTIEVQVYVGWANFSADAEARVVSAVAAGRVDLGWAGSRVFDTIGVPSFQALSAPMLIDGYPLERAVLASSMPAQMLGGLNRLGVTGLAILGEELRVPISAKRPLLAPSDWQGVGFGTLRSRVQEDAIRALGAVPVEAVGAYRLNDIRTGRIEALELDLRRYFSDLGVTTTPFAVPNVHLWPEFDVLLANPDRLASLTEQQRMWIRQAANAAARHSVTLADDSARYIKQDCRLGARFENATRADLAGLRSRLAVVYRLLERDPQTGSFISQIERLKRVTPPGALFPIPRNCSARA